MTERLLLLEAAGIAVIGLAIARKTLLNQHDTLPRARRVIPANSRPVQCGDSRSRLSHT